MTIDDVVSGLLERYSYSKKYIKTFKQVLETNLPSFFRGAIHAEATLMGLISCFSLDDDEGYIRRDTEILNFDTFKEDFRLVCCHLLSFIANTV